MAKHQFGLVGKNISYSFSRDYFGEKFQKLNLVDYSYENLDFQKIEEFPEFIKKNRILSGLNVTIPYKEAIIPYLDKLSKQYWDIYLSVKKVEIKKPNTLLNYFSK